MAQMNYRIVSQPYIGTEADLQDVLFPARTSAELADSGDRINTEDKFRGKVAFDTTLNQPVFASAAAAGAVWVVGALSQDFAVAASAGIAVTAESFGASVVRSGSLIHTTILIDITLLEGGDAGDIIGDDTPSVSHLGQITVARNGTLVYGTVTCLETPAGGDLDIDLYSADEGTGEQDTLIASLTNSTQLLNNGDWAGAVATPILMTALPADDQYLYLVDPVGDVNEFSAGRFLFEFYGV